MSQPSGGGIKAIADVGFSFRVYLIEHFTFSFNKSASGGTRTPCQSVKSRLLDHMSFRRVLLRVLLVKNEGVLPIERCLSSQINNRIRTWCFPLSALAGISTRITSLKRRVDYALSDKGRMSPRPSATFCCFVQRYFTTITTKTSCLSGQALKTLSLLPSTGD